MLGNFWKLYAGKFFGSHILENSGGCRRLFDEGNYDTMLPHHATDLRQWHQVRKLSITAAQIFPERCEVKALLEVSEVIGRSRRGMGMLNQCWLQK